MYIIKMLALAMGLSVAGVGFADYHDCSEQKTSDSCQKALSPDEEEKHCVWIEDTTHSNGACLDLTPDCGSAYTEKDTCNNAQVDGQNFCQWLGDQAKGGCYDLDSSKS